MGQHQEWRGLSNVLIREPHTVPGNLGDAPSWEEVQLREGEDKSMWELSCSKHATEGGWIRLETREASSVPLAWLCRVTYQEALEDS